MSQKRVVLLAAVVFLSVGITSFLMGQPAPTAVKQAATAPQVGRYQIVVNPTVRADTFLRDTQTGIRGSRRKSATLRANRQYGSIGNVWTTITN
jgi:hypothetical protein